MSRVPVLIGAVVGALAPTAAAQIPRSYPFALTAQASFVPLHGGDATVGGYAGIGPSLRVAYLPRFTRGRGFIEAHGTRTFAGGSSYKPQLTTFGVGLGALIGRPTSPLRGLVGAGLSRLHVAVENDNPCVPPLCFSEGGQEFRDAALTTLTAGAGVILPGGDRLGLRADLRVHRPLSAPDSVVDSGDTRLELALGLVIRW